MGKDHGLKLIEPVPIEDDLCTGGLALIEDCGLGARLVFYAWQTSYEGDAQVNVVKRKIVLPIEAFPAMAEQFVRFLIERGAPRPAERYPRVVR